MGADDEALHARDEATWSRRMRGRASFRLIAAACTLFASAPATASDIYFCKSVVTRPINLMDEAAEGVPVEELTPSIKRGTIIRHITQYRVDLKTGLTGFCAHFDRCYRDTAPVHGRRLKAQRLLNCTIDFKHPDKEEKDEIIYGLVADPRKVPASDIRVSDAFEDLLRIGIESERLAHILADQPRSHCARIARHALAGDRRARTGLENATAPPRGGMDMVLDELMHPDLYRDCV